MSEQTGIGAEGVFQTEWTVYTPTHTIRDARLGKVAKIPPFSSVLLMMADYTITCVQRITMSFIGGHRSHLPAPCPLPLSTPPLPSFI